MEALINDHHTQNLDILLIQEPSITTYGTHVNHSAWRVYQPTDRGEQRKRSLLYVNRRISTASHRQIRCNHRDVTAIKIWTTREQILVFSVYLPPINLHQASEEASTHSALDEIQSTIQQTSQRSDRPTRLILAGDFNRHHPAWSNNQVHHVFVRQAVGLVSFFQTWKLQWCLPRGIPTFWSLSHPGKTSTIDLTVTDSPGRLIRCRLYHDHYGSDHRATYSEWSLHPELKPDSKLKRNFDRADWEKIGLTVQTLMNPWPTISSDSDLELAVEKLVKSTTTAIEQHTPLMRPSPYSKRWFTPQLKQQQREVNQARRKWQESLATRGSGDPRTVSLLRDMRWKRRMWTRTIEKAKSTHWREFLDKASERVLWKAASYIGPRDSYGNVPALKTDSGEVSDNLDKARVFREAFFPQMIVPSEETSTRRREEIPWEPITELEVQKALRAAKATTAPGEDGIPTLVWKQLWKYVGKMITSIFTASIELGFYPSQWKRARIVIMRKDSRPDYSDPEAYRPISLLNTLGKLLEAVMAKRLSYYAETYRLLPDTQFGGRPGRNTEQALLVLTNAIDRAWRRLRVVTLIAFDLKGAFNGVNKISLDARLYAQGIPSKARIWIRSFMEARSASIKFDDFETDMEPLENAGLAQGSPLSPTLFAFFNSDLVDQPVNYFGGASAYIDDYFRWRVGKSAEDNIKKIQEEDIPRIEAWARRTGSCFALKKTELIHITRRKREHGVGQIIMQGTTIQPSPVVKLLGVVFDQELRWKQHVQQAVKRATKVNIAVGGLRYLRPAQMRQLYQACVTPVVDYASTVWHNPLKDKTHLRVLGTVQRAALIRILSAFKSTATQTMEVEAYILPTPLRLKKRAQNVITSLCTLSDSHPIHNVVARAKRRSFNVGTSARFPLAEAMKTMDLRQLETLETINPAPLAPWAPPVFAEISINTEREEASERAAALLDTPDTVVYSDASATGGQTGAAAVMLDQNQKITQSRQISVGPTALWTVHAAELIGIHQAIEMIAEQVSEGQMVDRLQGQTITILSDSQSALQAIARPSNKSGQHIVHSILGGAKSLTAHKVRLRLQWVPGHSDNPGNDAADRMAKAAVGSDESHRFHHLASRLRRSNEEKIITEWENAWKSSEKGGHLRKIDTMLPSPRTRRLYDVLPRNRSYLLMQLRTGHSWLATHAKRQKLRDDDKCQCGAKETVVHVLVDCPRLKYLRQQLRRKIGEAFNDISAMLGGKCQARHEQGKSGNVHDVLNAVLDFAEASQRFRSRVPLRTRQKVSGQRVGHRP
jgi:ribonuclease HI